MTANASAAPVHIAITRKIKPGYELEFQTALKEFFARSLAENGVRGASMLVPPPGSSSAEYGILRSFAGADERDAFYRSPLYLEWATRVAPLTVGAPQIRELTGLEAFFRTSDSQPPPPLWKMAVATYIGVEIVTLTVALTLGRALGGWNLFLSNPIQNVLVVGLLTWVVMPLVTKALSGWLNTKKRKSS
jgi:antibiotic biosynthesis monooxygenase (ABM) superfamily enzyme